MTQTRWLTADEQAVWHAYLRVQSELPARLNRQLQDVSGLSLADYEVLAHVSEADGGRLRVRQLALALQWEKSRVSHQLTRMERRELVARESCPDDARGAFVALTARGRRVLAQAAPGHVAEVRRLLFDALTPQQVAALGAILSAVLDRLDEQP